MRHATRVLARLFLVLAAAGVCGRGAAQPAPQPAPAPATCPTCPYGNPQSPRSLTAADWKWTTGTPAVRRRDADSIVYSPRVGVDLTLHRCAQHYHCRIENVQGCPAEHEPRAPEAACPREPPVDSWVEIHTVYHQGPLRVPTPQELDLCTEQPLVVVAHHAQVTRDTTPLPLVHFGPPSAEWSGSSTNPEPPDCKPAAYWAFALGCGFRVSQKQLFDGFDHPEEPRPLQTGDRLSSDLTHVVGKRRH